MPGRAFKGNPDAMSLSQPWVSPRHHQQRGVPLGWNLRTGKIVVMYMWSMPTHSTTVQIEGEKNSGKSTFMKTVMPRFLKMQGKTASGDVCLMRGRINTRKSEEGVAEYQPVTDFLYSPVYDLGNAMINLFGLFTREPDVIEVAINIAEEVKGSTLTGEEPLAIQVAVHKMMESMSEIRSPDVLAVLLRDMQPEDLKSYHLEGDQQMLKQFEEEFAMRPDLRKQLQLGSLEGRDVDTTAFITGARSASKYFFQLLRGNYGRSFGGKNSLYDVLSQQLVTLDWENMSEKARIIFEAVLMKAESSAISGARLGQGLDLTHIIPHINMGDEEGGAMKSLMHARFMAEKQNKSRAYPTADFRAVQYNTQVTEAGTAGSELRSLAKEIDLGIACRIVFRQPEDDDFLQRFSRLGWSDEDISVLPRLLQGQAAIWIRDHPPLFYQHYVTSIEHPLIVSNSARTTMATGVPITTDVDYVSRAKRLGVEEVHV